MRYCNPLIVFAVHCIKWAQIAAIESPRSATGQKSSSPSNPLPSVKDAVDDAFDVFEALEDRFEDTISHYSAFAGKIFPLLSKLYVSPKKARKIINEIRTVQEPGDWIFILTLGWITIPVVKCTYEKFVIGKNSRTKCGNTERLFKESLVYYFAEHVSQAGRIAAGVYVLDCVAIALDTMGFQAISQYSPNIAKAIYTVWIFSRVSSFKRFMVFKFFAITNLADKEDPGNRGFLARANIVDKFLDIFFIASCFFVLIDVLKIQSGCTLNSLFAVSGAGTVMISLASKDIIMEVLSGLTLQASDKVFEGEKVEFGNGLKGYVDHIGLFETLIRDSSEMVTAVPNKSLINQHLTNISRNQFSQVKQKLNFKYNDMEKLPALIEEIKRAVAGNCEFVISDGSKPFRVHFSKFGDSCLEVVVDVRMSVTPDSDYYHACKEKVLWVVASAVKRKNMEFAVLSE